MVPISNDEAKFREIKLYWIIKHQVCTPKLCEAWRDQTALYQREHRRKCCLLFTIPTIVQMENILTKALHKPMV